MAETLSLASVIDLGSGGGGGGSATWGSIGGNIQHQSDLMALFRGINEWQVVDTFVGVVGNAHKLYILTTDCTVGSTNYSKGFYTWDSTNSFVLRSSDIEVDNITVDTNASGELEVKDDGLEVKHIKTTAKTETITNDNTKVALSNAVYKEILVNATSNFDYDDSGVADKINIELKNNNGTTKIDKEIDFNDKLVLESKTQTITNKTIDADDNTVENLETDNFKNSALAKSTDNVRNYDASVDTKVATEKFIQKSLQNVFDPVNNNDATNKKYVDDEVSKLSGKVMKFKGFVSSTEPTGTITEGSFWYESSSLPTTFPINVKTYTNGAWSATTTEYSPTTLDLWADINTSKGYYWFGNGWNLIDENVLVDDYTINKDNLGNLQLKPQTPADKGKVWQVGDDGRFTLAHTSGIIEVEDLPTSDIRTDVVYHLNTPRRVFHDTSKVTNFVGYRSLDSLMTPTSEGIDVAGSLIVWGEIQDTFITDAISQGMIEECSFSDMDFGKYADNGYDYKSTFSETEPVSIYYVYDNGWLAITNLSIDGHIISDETTRQDLQLVGEDDIYVGSRTPKTDGIDIQLGEGNTPDPDIIQDGQNFRFATNKTSSNYYLNTRMDTIAAQAEGSNKTYFINYPGTLPDAGSRTLNAYYYIQIASGGTNYQRYFIDSTDVSHDLGTTEVNLSTMVPKTDVVVPDSSSTSGKVADAKGTYDNFAPIQSSYAHANNAASNAVDDCVFNFHYQSNNNRCSEIRLFSNARIGITPPFFPAVRYGTLIVLQTLQTSAKVIIRQEFYNGINEDNRASFYRIGVLENITWETIVENKANIVWSNWVPIEPSFSLRPDNNAIPADESVFDLPVVPTNNYFYSHKAMFSNTRFINPIDNAYIRSNCETKIDIYYSADTHANAQITQIATQIGWDGSYQEKKYKRIGLLKYDATNVPDVTKVYTYRNQIVWKNWYPVEYPTTNFTLDSTKATATTCRYAITGGVFELRMTGLQYTTSTDREAIGSLPVSLTTLIKSGDPIFLASNDDDPTVTSRLFIERSTGNICVTKNTSGAQTRTKQLQGCCLLGY